jgi:hypothetical protein
MTEQDQQGQPTSQPSDPAGTAETRQQQVTEVRKAAYGEIPPLFGLVATPGEVTGTPAPDAVPSTAPTTDSSPSTQASTEGGS